MRLFVSRLVLVLTFVVGVAAAIPARAQKPDAREVKARELFGIGRYAEALDIYGKLYAETTHPTYMRNIGRCYQNMGEPDKAISSFREYLRQARDLTPDQRAQVEGYIREMEDLKRKRESSSPPPAGVPPPITTPPPGGPPPLAAVPPPGSPIVPSPLVGVPSADTGTPAPTNDAHSRRIAGFVVGGATVAALITGSAFGLLAFSKRHASDDHCPTVSGMERCSVEGVTLNDQAKTAALVSDIAFGVGVVGAAVTTYLLVSSRGKEAQPTGTVARRVRVSPELGPGGARLVLGASW